MKAPNFSLKDQDSNTVTLDSLKGKKVVLYFYPKADTPGCTLQACGMRDNIGAIKAAGARVVGISPDEVKDLKKFQQKYSLNYELLADPTTNTCQAYGVWQQKQFMGRTYMGVVRSTFLLDEQGNTVKSWEKVNPEQHADMILAELTGKPAPMDLMPTKSVKPVAPVKIAPAKKLVAKKAVKKAKRTLPKRKTPRQAAKKRAIKKKK